MVSVVLWASAFVAIRDVRGHLSAGSLALVRLLVGACALGVVMLARRESLPARRVLPLIALSGLLWFALYNVALNQAEHSLDAGTSSMLVNLGPIGIAVLAGWALHEGFPPRLAVGCAVGVAGAVVIGLSTGGHHSRDVTGVLLCVVAAAAYAGGVVAQKPALRTASALQVTFTACAVGAIACLPFAPQLAGQLQHAPGSAIAAAVYLGLFPTAVGFLTWAYALARTDAGRLGVTTYLVPPMVVVLAWVWLGEHPPPAAFAGGCLCLAAVAIVRSR